jgi:hypothetical protein
LNNPLKYTDPSGFSDVAVTTEALPPEVIEYAELLGVDIDTRYTVTSATGEKITGLGNSAANGAATIYELSNTMRKMEGDYELNIVIPGEDIRDSIMYRYTYDADSGDPVSWGKYFYIGESIFFPGSSIWQLYESSMGPEPYDWVIGLDLVIVGGVCLFASLPTTLSAIAEAGFLDIAIIKGALWATGLFLFFNTFASNILSIGNITLNWDPLNPSQLIIQY